MRNHLTPARVTPRTPTRTRFGGVILIFLAALVLSACAASKPTADRSLAASEANPAIAERGATSSHASVDLGAAPQPVAQETLPILTNQITLAQSFWFPDPELQLTELGAGDYEVSHVDRNRLLLKASDGSNTQLAAERVPDGEPVEEVLAIFESGDKESPPAISLMLPDGAVLHAVGSETAVQERGAIRISRSSARRLGSATAAPTCRAGTYARGRTCAKCPAGYRCLRNARYACKGAYFQGYSGRSYCSTAPRATYTVPTHAATRALKCPAGSYCSGGVRRVCPRGFYCPAYTWKPVSSVTFRNLKTRAKLSRNHTVAKFEAKSRARAKRLEQIIAPERAKLLRVLQADRTGQYAAMQSKLNSILGNRNLSRGVRLQQLNGIKAQYAPFVRREMGKARINLGALNARVKGEFSDLEIKIDGGLDLRVIRRLMKSSGSTTAQSVSVPQGQQCYTPSFTSKKESIAKTGLQIAGGSVSANKLNGRSSANVWAVGPLGVNSGNIEISQLVVVPPGVGKVKVTASMPVNSLSLYAGGAGGVTAASLKKVLEVAGPDDFYTESGCWGLICDDEWVVFAPVIWWSEEELTDETFERTLEFVPSPSGGDYLVTQLEMADTINGASVGYASVEASNKLNEICVEFAAL